MNYIYKRIKNFFDNSYLSIKRNECCNLIIYIAFPIYFKKSLAYILHQISIGKYSMQTHKNYDFISNKHGRS